MAKKKITVSFPKRLVFIKVAPGTKFNLRILDEPFEQEIDFGGKIVRLWRWLVYDWDDNSVKCVSLAKNASREILELMAQFRPARYSNTDIILARIQGARIQGTRTFPETIVKLTSDYKNTEIDIQIEKNWQKLTTVQKLSEVDSIMKKMGYPMHP